MHWVNKFKKVFDSLEKEFAEVLKAYRCREGWLQGEFFRRLKNKSNDFSVNDYPIAKKQTADFHAVYPKEMVAELKILGACDYYKKNIDGNCDLKNFTPKRKKGRIFVTNRHLKNVNSKEGSILKDFLRLKSIKEKIEKYQILVIHKNGSADELGRAALAIKLPGTETTLNYKDFIVRIWKV